MHILYLHQHFVARSGTSGGRSHEFSRLLVERGHQVTLVTGAYEQSGLPPLDGQLVSRLNIDGIEVTMVNAPYRQEMAFARRLLAFAHYMLLGTWEALQVDDVDVVYATSTPLTIAIPGMIASLVHRRPFVFEVRDLWPAIPIELGILRNPLLKGAARWLERTAYRRAARIVALSPGMKDGIMATGAPEEKVTVIPNSSDVGLFRVPDQAGRAFRAAHPAIRERPLLVYAGAFGRINSLTYVVRLAALVRKRDPAIAFLLVGRGNERPEVRRLAEERGLLDQTLFIQDPLPRAELPSLLSAADMLSSFALPLPTVAANSANKFFDALAAGKPLVINYEGWQAKLLRDTGAGLVLDAHDLDRAANQLVEAFHDPDWMGRAAAASRRLGEDRFERRKHVADLERVLLAASGNDEVAK